MDTVYAIFTQLGVNSSFVPQFIIFVIIFILSKFLFLERLQNVLDTREEKTIKLESSADDTFDKAQKMVEEYQGKMAQFSSEINKEINSKKSDVLEEMRKKFKQEEQAAQDKIDNESTQFETELSEKSKHQIAEVDSLSDSLLKKIVQ